MAMKLVYPLHFGTITPYCLNESIHWSGPELISSQLTLYLTKYLNTRQTHVATLIIYVNLTLFFSIADHVIPPVSKCSITTSGHVQGFGTPTISMVSQNAPVRLYMFQRFF